MKMSSPEPRRAVESPESANVALPVDWVAQAVAARLDDFLAIVEPDFAHRCLVEEAILPPTSTEGTSLVAIVPVRGEQSDVTVIVQIEAAPLTPDETARRFNANLLELQTRFTQPVLFSVIYLKGGRPGINLESTVLRTVEGLDSGVRIFYTSFGLSEARAEHFLARPEPLGWVLAIFMRPQRLSFTELHRACHQRLTTSGLDGPQRLLLTEILECAASLRVCP